MHSHGWIIRFGRAVAVLRGDAVAGAADDTFRLTRRAERRVVPIMAEPMSTVCWRNIMSRRRRGGGREGWAESDAFEWWFVISLRFLYFKFAERGKRNLNFNVESGSRISIQRTYALDPLELSSFRLPSRVSKFSGKAQVPPQKYNTSITDLLYINYQF